MSQAALQSYQTQQIMTASPAKLVAMLIDKAIASLNEASAAIERGDTTCRHNANRKAIDIVAHLWGTLDLDRGGEIAANLDRLYAFMMRRLGDVDIRNDAQAARDVIKLLDPLRKSWHELASRPAVPATTVQPAAPGRSHAANGETPAVPEGLSASVTLSA